MTRLLIASVSFALLLTPQTSRAEPTRAFYGVAGLEVVGGGRRGGDDISPKDLQLLAEAARLRRAEQARLASKAEAKPPQIGFRCGCANRRSGQIDKGIVRAHVRRKKNQIRHCYQQELWGTPKFTARVVLHFTVISSGALTDIRVSGTKRATLTECIETAMESWRFPGFTNSTTVVEVTYPVRFRASNPRLSAR